MSENLENFDPETFDPETFDPENYAGQLPRVAKTGGLRTITRGLLAQLDIKIVNATAAALGVELFNYINSFANVKNASLVAFDPMTFADIAKANTNSRVYFDANGNLIIEDATGAKCTISCRQTAYRSVFESSANQPFKVEKLRLTVTNDSQIDNEIVHVDKTFLGKTRTNSMSPRSFLNPNQFQSKIVDIPASFLIDSEKGLQTIVNAGETITLNLFIGQYKKVTL